VFSHVAADISGHSPAEAQALGWKNHLTTGEIEGLLAELGFTVMERKDSAEGKTRIWIARTD
jgi:hypothetical protein